MKVAKVFNNNVVLADAPDGRSLVLMGCGIGFQVRPGDRVDPARVQQTFAPSADNTAARIAAYLEQIGSRELDLAADIVEIVGEEFGESFPSSVVLPLADHISVAMARAKKQIVADYPIRWEVEALYPREAAMGRKALTVVKDKTGVELPDFEALPLALHFANAESGAPGAEKTRETADALQSVLELVQQELGLTLSTQDLDVARFITHLRYLALRQGGVDNDPEDLGEILQSLEGAHEPEVATARRVAAHLRDRYGWRITKNEVTYLALHITRLAGAAGGVADVTDVGAGAGADVAGAAATLARQIYGIVGGSENLTSISACATRLRLGIDDIPPKMLDELQDLPDVAHVVPRAGEIHLIVNTNLSATLKALRAIPA